MDLSIIIVNYKTRGLVLNCLKSIQEANLSNLEYEIIVVDNHSQDNLEKILNWQYPQVKFISSSKNIGMGAGNNLGLKLARGEYSVVMNPDTMVFPNTFRLLYNFMEQNKKVGVVGPKQYNPDKTTQNSCYRWHKLLTPFYRRTSLGKTKAGRKELDRFLMKNFLKNETREVDWLLGSFLFIRTSALKQIGYFDEHFFLYFEDTDLCRRFWKNSWKVVYYPQAEIIHNHKRASAKTPIYKFFIDAYARAHVFSWLKYLWKWRNDKIKSL